ncbi:MAG: surface-adhesin E family protein [Pseudomonadota bacterium]
MRTTFFALASSLLLAATPASHAEPSWLTVVGDPANPGADTVQVDATSAVAFDAMRMVRLRANRSSARTAGDGKPYRSYISQVMINCQEKSAWHRSISLFNDPLWKGQLRMVDYKEGDDRNLAFAEMPADPKGRLIKAACAIALQPGGGNSPP